ncbi:ribose-5-phosphate isomerase RpiA [Niabella insulamsoli]|uniref:ribose-5-phosphate isomerase RpiA n=1 Tax=Niabella insulamsoli TaxID=3144874 RepID=UPI0031FDEBBA
MNNDKKIAAEEAVKEIKNGMVVGLGTGSTAYYAIHAVGALVKNGMQLLTVPTSEQTKQMSIELGIPMVDINTIDAIDVTIDGADEFTQNLELIKGGGGALLREKIVASLTKKQIIVADSSKLVGELGKFKVPVEVIPFAKGYVTQQLKTIGGIGLIRTKDGKEYVTDQGNCIIDADFGLIENPAKLDEQINQIVGVVEHGLFIGLADRVIMAKDGETISFSK